MTKTLLLITSATALLVTILITLQSEGDGRGRRLKGRIAKNFGDPRTLELKKLKDLNSDQWVATESDLEPAFVKSETFCAPWNVNTDIWEAKHRRWIVSRGLGDQGRCFSPIETNTHLELAFHQGKTFCVAWNVNTDDWETRHQRWFVSHEGTDARCFSPIETEDHLEVYEPSQQANLPHFLIHIPKTGGVFARSIINEYARNRYTLCEMHLKPVTTWETWPHHNDKGVPCLIYMSEAHYAPHFANHTYTVVRDPKEHIVSQYFHCKESPQHKNHLLMPSLDEWLETWTRVLQQGPLPLTQAKETEMRRKYNCYNPINLQSRFLGFRHDDIIRQQDLRTRFDVLGVNSDLHKSICVMLIQMEPGVIPQQCDCTHASAAPPPSLDPYAHGVQHHGSTFALTTRQANLIANLAQQDEVLYRLARRVFQDQVRVIEEEYSIRLCDSAPTKQPPPE